MEKNLYHLRQTSANGWGSTAAGDAGEAIELALSQN